MTHPTASELLERIQNYLEVGGLWNPEMMEHDKVRTLIMDCRKYIEYTHKHTPSFIKHSTFVTSHEKKPKQ